MKDNLRLMDILLSAELHRAAASQVRKGDGPDEQAAQKVIAKMQSAEPDRIAFLLIEARQGDDGVTLSVTGSASKAMLHAMLTTASCRVRLADGEAGAPAASVLM